MSKGDARKKINNNFNNGKSVNDIDASGTLYLDKSKSSSSVARNRPKSAERANVSMPNLKPKHGSDHTSLKDKKSIWNWKPLKALSQVRNRRFNCGFTLEVHTIEGLPTELNGLSISVHWKRRDVEKVTKPIKVVEGVAEFREKLIQTCSVHGSRNGSHDSAKYEAKHFLLCAAVHEYPKLDLGKHRIDLTRLLPLTLEELEGEKSSGSWTTSFKLLGKANGAVMNVIFGYVVLGDNVAPNNKNVLKLLESNSTARSNIKSNPVEDKGSIRRSESCPSNQKSSMTSRPVDDVQVLHEVTPERISEFSSPVNTSYQKFDDEKSNSLLDGKSQNASSADDVQPLKSASCSPSKLSSGTSVDENEHAEFSIIEKGIESVEENLGLEQNSAKFVDHTAEESPDSPIYGIQGYLQEELEKRKESVEENLGLDRNSAKFVDQTVEEGPDSPVCYDGIQGDLPEEPDFIRDEDVTHDSTSKQKEMSTKEALLEDLESALTHVANLEKEVLDTPETKSESSDWGDEVEDKPNGMSESNLDDTTESDANLEEEESDTPEAQSEESSDWENEVEDKPYGMTQPNLDDIVESVAGEFLSKLGVPDSPIDLNSDLDPESPRERLLREFQKETEASGCSIFCFDVDKDVVEDYGEEDEVGCSYKAPTVSLWDDFSEVSDILPVEPESPDIRAKVVAEYPKIRAKVMEDLETESLVQEWGLDEKAFESSPPSSAGGCGSPIYLSPKEPPPLPSLGEGLGSFVQMKNGGFLRSMNPVLFSDAKSGGSLIMQVSSPVVVPAQLGSEVEEILQNLASVGLEQLSMQANKLMPLEEISGTTIQQIAWESAHLEASERHDLVQDVQEGSHVLTSTEIKGAKGDFSSQKLRKWNSNCIAAETNTEYVSLEDLAPLAMDKIEALSIEGLRVQCGMAEEEAPSDISSQSIREFSAPKAKRVGPKGFVGLEGAVGLQLLNLEDKDTGCEEVEGLMGLSVTLDEWMKLDSGEIDEGERISERTSKILAAHHANFADLKFFGKKKRKTGLLGNNLTIALMVQLRDSLRNYEPVGTPMLALIQVERFFLPPKPKIYSMVPKARANDDDEDNELEFSNKVEDTNLVGPKEEITEDQELVPQYKISDVHLAGLATEPGKKKPWGSAFQQQSGSRWLLANGMGKSNKHSFMRSRVTPHPGDILWSISSRFQENRAKSKELACHDPHIRNPNVILPN